MHLRGKTGFGKMAIIMPAAFINSLAIGSTSLGFLFVVKDLYLASPAMVGSLGALWSTSYLAGCLLLRKLARRLDPRVAMTASVSAGAVALAAFLAFPGLWQAYAALAAYGFFTALFWPPLMGWVSRGLEGPELSRATNLFSVSWSVGGIFSSYVAGMLSERGKFLPIALSAGLLALDAALIIASRSLIKDEAAAAAGAQAPARAEDRSTPLRFPAWLGAFLMYAVMGVVLNVFPVYALDELALKESSIGFLLTLRSTATSLGFYLLSRLTFWQFKRAALPVLSATAAAALVAMIFIRSAAGFSVAFVGVGLLLAAAYNSSFFYATSGALDRDRRVLVHEMLLTFGQVVGSISGGIVYQASSIATVFLGLCALLAFGAGAQAVMVSRPDRRQAAKAGS